MHPFRSPDVALQLFARVHNVLERCTYISYTDNVHNERCTQTREVGDVSAVPPARPPMEPIPSHLLSLGSS